MSFFSFWKLQFREVCICKYYILQGPWDFISESIIIKLAWGYDIFRDKLLWYESVNSQIIKKTRVLLPCFGKEVFIYIFFLSSV